MYRTKFIFTRTTMFLCPEGHWIETSSHVWSSSHYNFTVRLTSVEGKNWCARMGLSVRHSKHKIINLDGWESFPFFSICIGQRKRGSEDSPNKVFPPTLSRCHRSFWQPLTPAVQLPGAAILALSPAPICLTSYWRGFSLLTRDARLNFPQKSKSLFQSIIMTLILI